MEENNSWDAISTYFSMINRIYSNMLQACIYYIDCSKLQLNGLFWLEEESKKRMNRYKRECDKRLLIGSEIVLYKGISERKEISCQNQWNSFWKQHSRKRDSNGKPYIESADFKYNISHSGNYAVCILADSEVGIDIEYILSSNIDVAKRFYTKQEYSEICAMSNKTIQAGRATEYWVMKESFIKAIGLGLRIGLNSFSFTWLYENIWLVNQHRNEKKYVIEIMNFPDCKYKLAICKEINDISLLG